LRAEAIRIGWTLLPSILLLLLLTGCGGEQAMPLRVGTNAWAGYEPFYLARDLDYYAATSVRFKEFGSATEVLRSFRNGAIDAAALTLDEVLLLLEDGFDLQIVLVCDASAGADAIIAWPPIHSVADLAGKRVGLENKALGAYVLSRALELKGLDPGALTVVPAEPLEHEGLLRKGRVEAVVTYEPVRSRLLAAGASEIFSSSEIPNEVIDVLVVRGEVLRKAPGLVRELLAGWFKAVAFIETHPEESSRRMASRLKLAPAEVLASLQGIYFPPLPQNLLILGGKEVLVEAAGERLAKVMVAHRLLRNPVSLQDRIATAPMEGLRP